jgi:hypothetical protein
MTLAPGYYWIRWPGSARAELLEWQPCLVRKACVSIDAEGRGVYRYEATCLGEDLPYFVDGAEIGTRIEPPLPTGDVKLGERVRGMLIALSDEERVSALSDADICHHCGKDMRASSRPYCSCTNDE